MSPKYSFPIDYEEPFKDPWYYPTVCMGCFVWKQA
jgi:hypothetical protein